MVKSGKRKEPTMAQLRHRIKYYGGSTSAKTKAGLKAALTRAKQSSQIYDIRKLPGKRSGRFMEATGIPCMWMPDDTLLKTADRMGLKRRAQNYRATKRTLCAKISSAIKQGISLGASGLTPQAAKEAFLKEHPQAAIKHAKKVHKKVKKKAPVAAAALAAAHNAHSAQAQDLSSAVERMRAQLKNIQKQYKDSGPGWRLRWQAAINGHSAQAAQIADQAHVTDVAPSAPPLDSDSDSDSDSDGDVFFNNLDYDNE